MCDPLLSSCPLACGKFFETASSTKWKKKRKRFVRMREISARNFPSGIRRCRSVRDLNDMAPNEGGWREMMLFVVVAVRAGMRITAEV